MKSFSSEKIGNLLLQIRVYLWVQNDFRSISHRLARSGGCWKPVYLLFICLDYFFMQFWISRHPHLKRIDNIYINMKTRNIEMLNDNEFINPVVFRLRRFELEKFFHGRVLKIEDEIFDNVIDILCI